MVAQIMSPALRRSALVFTLIVAGAGFFVFYNMYLVDRSLVRLNISLREASDIRTLADFEKIKPHLKVFILKEIAKMTISPKALMSMELAQNIVTTAKTKDQMEDVIFYLKTLIDARQKEQGGFFALFGGKKKEVVTSVDATEGQLRARASELLAKIDTTSDPEMRQGIYYELGNISIQLSDVKNAEGYFNKVTEIKAGNFLSLKARFNLAWFFKLLGEFDRAITLFETLAKDCPGTEIGITSLYQVADAFYKKGDYTKARDLYATCYEQDPQSEIADLVLFQAGYISFYNLNDRDTATKYFNELEKKFKNFTIAKHAVESTVPAMSKEFRDKGFKLLRDKQYNDAIDSFKKAVEIAPNDGVSYSGTSLGYYWLNEKESALKTARKATDMMGMSGEETKLFEVTLVNAMFVYINSGDLDRAIQLGEEVQAKVKVTSAEFFYNLGYAYMQKSKVDQAIRSFTTTLKLNKDFVYAHNNLGCAYWTLMQYAEAMKEFKQAVDLQPTYTDARYNLGVVYYYLNQISVAEQWFRSVLKENPSYKEAEDFINVIQQQQQQETQIMQQQQQETQ